MAAGAAGAGYVITQQDPIAIALRQLSIVAIEAYGTEVSAALGMCVRVFMCVFLCVCVSGVAGC